MIQKKETATKALKATAPPKREPKESKGRKNRDKSESSRSRKKKLRKPAEMKEKDRSGSQEKFLETIGEELKQ